MWCIPCLPIQAILKWRYIYIIILKYWYLIYVHAVPHMGTAPALILNYDFWGYMEWRLLWFLPDFLCGCMLCLLFNWFPWYCSNCHSFNCWWLYLYLSQYPMEEFFTLTNIKFGTLVSQVCSYILHFYFPYACISHSYLLPLRKQHVLVVRFLYLTKLAPNLKGCCHILFT